MTLPKNLQEKRDELCEYYKQECIDNWHSPGLYLKPDFNKGFEAACALLLPEIEKLREALNHYNQWSSLKEPDEADIRSDVDCGCCSHGSTGAVAYKALQSLREFLGEL